MLLTLSAISMHPSTDGGGKGPSLFDLPRVASEELDLRGLNIQTSLLSGWELGEIDRLRDSADKAGCPCLLLIEEQPHCLADERDERASGSLERLGRVLRVAHRLGCSGVVVGIEDDKGDDAADLAAERIKDLVSRAERLEINLLLVNRPGLTETPERLTELIRAVGGFRIGSAPDFELAAASGDPESYLRSLTPYASAVCASTREFDAKGKHVAFDLVKCIEAIRSVGYEGTLSLEYRGKGDPMKAILATKAIVESLVGASD